MIRLHDRSGDFGWSRGETRDPNKADVGPQRLLSRYLYPSPSLRWTPAQYTPVCTDSKEEDHKYYIQTKTPGPFRAFLPYVQASATLRAMTFLDAVILGIVEGLTEFLPISSTGHLILTGHLLGIEESAFLGTFDIVIQLGAILAVVFLYGGQLLLQRALLLRTIVAFLPTGIIGLLVYPVVKDVFLTNPSITVYSLLIGGIILIVFEQFHREKQSALDDLATLPLWKAALIGVFQSLAVVPGTSRAAATIIGGLCLGMKRASIVQFSFLLAIPTMAAASGYDLLKTAPSFSGNELWLLSVGFAVSLITAFLAVKWFLRFVRSHSFTPFGIERIAVAVLFLTLIL